MASNVTSFRPLSVNRASKETLNHYSIVIAGEFNSGKSSVLNLLLRQPVLPTSVGYSHMPPLRVFPSDTKSYHILSNISEPMDREKFVKGMIPGKSVRSARIELPLEQFNGAMITEVSVGQHGELEPEAEAILNSADLLIWCTMGQRAWCLTEITIVEKLPRKLLDNAILAMTRSDYLKSDTDRAKVMTRLNREASQYFNKILLVDASGRSIREAKDPAHWEISTGRALFEAVMGQFKRSSLFGREMPVADLQPLDAFKTQKQQPASEKSHKPDIGLLWNAELADIKTTITNNPDPKSNDVARFILGRISDFANTRLRQTTNIDDQSAMLRGQFLQAEKLLQRMCANQNQTATNRVAQNALDLAFQLAETLKTQAKSKVEGGEL